MPNKPERLHCKFDDCECLFFQLNDKEPEPLDCIGCSLREIATVLVKTKEREDD